MKATATLTVQTLAAGDCRLLNAATGSRWTLAAGAARLTEPLRDLGERLVGVDLRLNEGSSHVIDSGGWVRVQALTACTLVVEPAALPSRLAPPGWRHWLARRVLYKPA